MTFLVRLGLSLSAAALASLAARDARADPPLAPLAEEAPSPPAEAGHVRRVVGIGLLGLGGAGLIASGIGTAVAWTSEADECADCSFDRGSFERARAIGVGGLVLSGGVLATGVVLVLTAPSARADATARRLRPTARGVAFTF